jgi:hypothetical protein
MRKNDRPLGCILASMQNDQFYCAEQLHYIYLILNVGSEPLLVVCTSCTLGHNVLLNYLKFHKVNYPTSYGMNVQWYFLSIYTQRVLTKN